MTAEKGRPMKNNDLTTQELNENINSKNESENNSLAWDDIVVYNEMAEQTSFRMNLLEQINKQMSQLEEMSARRQFLTKELMNYFSK